METWMLTNAASSSIAVDNTLNLGIEFIKDQDQNNIKLTRSLTIFRNTESKMYTDSRFCNIQ